MKSPATLFAYQSMTRPQRHDERPSILKPKRSATLRMDWTRLVQLLFFIR